MMFQLALASILVVSQVHGFASQSGTCDATAQGTVLGAMSGRTWEDGSSSRFSLSMDGDSFKLGAANTIRVKRKSGTTGFRGLLLYVEDSTNTRIGTMATPANTQIKSNCAGSNTLTHTSSTAGDNTFSADQTFTWTAPASVSGPITIYVIAYETGARIFNVPTPVSVNVMTTTTQSPPTTVDCSRVLCPPLLCDFSDSLPPLPGQCCRRCPPTTQAPPSCPPNFVFRRCQSCNATCANPNPICTKICRPPGCNCVPPNALDARGNCIRSFLCPRLCRDRNEEYLRLGLVAPRRCSLPYPTPITFGMRPRPACYCRRGYVRGAFNRCIPLWQCCRRTSYPQATKDLTRYSSCIPATIDVGTCSGTCGTVQSPFSRFCPICDVASYATQRVRCRNFVGAQVSVNIDIVKSCGCRNVFAVPTGINTRRPTRRPTQRPSS